MTASTASASADLNLGQLVYASRIAADSGVTGRTIRKWIVKGILPAPDGNLNGRNFWTASTYRHWRASVLAGKYKQASRFQAQSVSP